METSAKDGDNVNKAFLTLAETIKSRYAFAIVSTKATRSITLIASQDSLSWGPGLIILCLLQVFLSPSSVFFTPQF